MNAINTLLPVLFMICLGMISRVKGFITPKQKDGANALVFNILFPIMIFSILFSSKIESSALLIVLYVFIVFVLSFIVGKLLGKFTGERFSHISHFMMTTCEGGNVALPLYLSIVGASNNTVIFDLGGVIFAFILIPILVSKESSRSTSTKDLVKTIVTNPFVISVFLGLGLNLLGVYELLSNSIFIDAYTNTVQQATAPIVGIILFIIGYNLKINTDTISYVLKLLLVRILFYILVIIGFYILFPSLMSDKVFMIGVLIYFTSPTGFAIPLQISPLFKNEDDESYTSAIISLNMIITLIVYAIIVIFIA